MCLNAPEAQLDSPILSGVFSERYGVTHQLNSQFSSDDLAEMEDKASIMVAALQIWASVNGFSILPRCFHSKHSLQ